MKGNSSVGEVYFNIRTRQFNRYEGRFQRRVVKRYGRKKINRRLPDRE